MISDWFDRYALQARLAPSLLCLFPVFLIVAVRFPALYETAAGLVGLALACGILTAFSHFARSQGKNAEARLVNSWGGLPTTLMLENRKSEIDTVTHQRYLSFFQDRIPNWSLGADERAAYESAVRWLIGKTRDGTEFPMVLKENISYGFRRNCRGLKSYGLACTAGCMVFLGYSFQWSLQAVANANAAITLSTGVVVLLFFWWLFVVRDSWVREAGDAYAKALISTADHLEET